MSSLRNKYNIEKTWFGLLLVFMFLFFISGVSYAQDSMRKFPDYYPEKFNAIGTIDRIAEGEIVVGDTLYTLSSDATYHTPTLEDASKALFSAGSHVGVITDPKRVVRSLWLIE